MKNGDSVGNRSPSHLLPFGNVAVDLAVIDLNGFRDVVEHTDH